MTRPGSRAVTMLPLLLSLAGVACAPAPAVKLVSHDAIPGAVALEPRAGSRVNARVAPAVEFQDGSVVRLTKGRIDAAGDYFVEPPHATFSAPPGTPVIVRASVCVDGERLCRSVEQRTTLPSR